ncbi:tRNA 2-thiouridine(34) synthase MnmA [Dehalogenimonas sp. THU2]|uniref:tRNA 2-thiouridine(34) synthase MnmA n=1 Tax=Dehalogenimonas sp. THU2 TaxID=3151121 RepID=UPI003218991D
MEDKHVQISADTRAPRILVALSGGVDSAVAAALMKKSGAEVTGIIMTIYGGEDTPVQTGHKHGCYGPGEAEDVRDAQAVADALGIKLYVFDLKAEYQTAVLDHFKAEYQAGRTPNPCVYCNQRIKLGALLEKASASGIEFDFVVTGHYARTEYDPATGRYRLLRGINHDKDQSYFLSRLSQEQLKKVRFPLGELTKEEVRRLADGLKLPVAEKEESQNFIAGGYRQLVCGEAKPGPILDESGKVLGSHPGVAFFTLGQRQGLGLAAKEPLYVIRIEPEQNAIIVGGKEAVYRSEVLANDLNWISIENLTSSLDVAARIRSGASPVPARIESLGPDRIKVVFNEPQMAPAPGQAIVLYDGEVVVGSGVINH